MFLCSARMKIEGRKLQWSEIYWPIMAYHYAKGRFCLRSLHLIKHRRMLSHVAQCRPARVWPDKPRPKPRRLITNLTSLITHFTVVCIRNERVEKKFIIKVKLSARSTVFATSHRWAWKFSSNLEVSLTLHPKQDPNQTEALFFSNTWKIHIECENVQL